MSRARPAWIAIRTILRRGGRLPTVAPASPIRCRSGAERSKAGRIKAPLHDGRPVHNGRLGEFDLIAALRARLPRNGPAVLLGVGDDAAVTAPEGVTATSVDAVVEGVHFRRRTTPLEAIGRKALAAGLSDLAAMGAAPGEAYIVLGVPPDLDEAGCLELLDGAGAVAARTGTVLAGGDISRSETLFVALTVVGHAGSAESLVSRRGASPGDAIAVTGELGGAAAGLLLLEGDAGSAELAGEVEMALRARQLDPQPRLAEGRALSGAGASAMIDISDGLGGDAAQIAAESGVRLEIDLAEVPLQAGLREVAESGGRDPLELAAAGGEDYELLACLPAQAVEGARAAVGGVDGSLTVIGRCVEGEGVMLSAPGRELRVRGYDHLA
jgi:thiamine-monophosphate kinase